MLKRLVYALVGLSVLLACYAVYLAAVGRLFGLEELPPELAPPGPGADQLATAGLAAQDFPRRTARRIFGPDSWQAKADIALYWERSGTIVYIADYEQTGPKKLRLHPFCLVHLDPHPAPGTRGEIVTLRADNAELLFDKPIELMRMSGTEPTAARVTGNIQLHADRATADRADDILAYTDHLELQWAKQRAWTEAPVRIVMADAVANATGMELHLKVNESKRASSSSRFVAVRQVVLLHDVRLQMLASNLAGLLNPKGQPRRAADKTSKKQEPKTPVTLTCNGPFTYDLQTSTARFNRQVQVARQTAEGQFDRLFCDQLVLAFKQTKPTSPAGASQLRLRTAQATGKPVRIVSDSSQLRATGTSLEHLADTGQTVLRGEPEVTATMGPHVLRAQELRLTRLGDTATKAVASGPGWIRVKQPDGPVLRASWQQQASLEPTGSSQKADGPVQKLTLRGAVTVDQPGQGQLQARQVAVWLKRSRRTDRNASGTSTFDRQAGLAVSRIEALDECRVHTERLDIAANRLDMSIEEAAASAGRRRPTPAATAGRRQPARPRGARPRTGMSGGKRAGKEKRAPEPEQPPDNPPSQPARLQAGLVQAKAIRSPDATQLAELWTQDGVDLWLPGQQPDGQPAIIKGSTLHLQRLEHGYKVEVTGQPAHVELRDITIEGPTVAVDQELSVAWVEGQGTMSLPAATALDGQQLDRPGRINISWGSNMFFNGSVAEFGGGVDVFQAESRLHCGQLEAYFTQRIDLANPKTNKGQSARIRKLVCSNGTELVNRIMRDGELQKEEYIQAQTLTFDQQQQSIVAQGPGTVRTLTAGPSPFQMAVNQPAAPPSGDQAGPDTQLVLTQVRFRDQMQGDRRSQTARFWGRVEVIHSPVQDSEQQPDADHLPPGGLILHCRQLEVGAHNGPGQTTYHELIGSGEVEVEARNFRGLADRISYSQLHERLIFEATRPDAEATLWHQAQPGMRPNVVRARKFYYRRRTQEIRVEEGSQFDYQKLGSTRSQPTVR